MAYLLQDLLLLYLFCIYVDFYIFFNNNKWQSTHRDWARTQGKICENKNMSSNLHELFHLSDTIYFFFFGKSVWWTKKIKKLKNEINFLGSCNKLIVVHTRSQLIYTTLKNKEKFNGINKVGKLLFFRKM